MLLLDNFEQVVECSRAGGGPVRSLSQTQDDGDEPEVLHVRGEQEFAVPPLAVPDPKHLPDLVALSQYEAVALHLACSGGQT